MKSNYSNNSTKREINLLMLLVVFILGWPVEAFILILGERILIILKMWVKCLLQAHSSLAGLYLEVDLHFSGSIKKEKMTLISCNGRKIRISVIISIFKSCNCYKLGKSRQIIKPSFLLCSSRRRMKKLMKLIENYQLKMNSSRGNGGW